MQQVFSASNQPLSVFDSCVKPAGMRILLYSVTKGVKRKGVYYVFLSKQHLDNVYTRVAIYRFALGPLHTVAHGR